MKNIILKLLLVFAALPVVAQTQVKGIVTDGFTEKPISEVTVSLEGSTASSQTNALGAFTLNQGLPLGEQILVLNKEGYVTKRMPVIINENALLDMGETTLAVDVIEEQRSISLITLNDNCRLYTSPSPRDLSTSRMPSSA